jgi:hypothetical protein
MLILLAVQCSLSLSLRTNTATKPIAPVDAIVQLYSQYELDILKQKHKGELRDMEKDHNKFLNIFISNVFFLPAVISIATSASLSVAGPARS